MAQHTRRVRLGASCWNPYTLHPYEIAGQVAALDLASDGRAYLGIARGAWLSAIGVQQPHPIATIREAIGLVWRLLARDPRGFQGQVFRVEPGIALRYEVLRPRVPLLVGTWGTKLAELGGELADEVKVGGSANPRMVNIMRERIAVGAARAGRRVDEVGIVLGAVTVVDEDGVRARCRARTEVAMYADVVAGLDPTLDVPLDLRARIAELVRRGEHQAAGQLISGDLLDALAFAGTPEHVIRQVERVLEAGARRVEFGTPHGLTDDRGLELLGSSVLPYFR